MIMEQLTARLNPTRLKRYWDSSVWRCSRIGERGEWAKHAMQPENASGALSRLSDAAREALRAMIDSFGVIPAPEERLLKELRANTALSGAQCRIGLQELETAGILFAISETWGERELFMPANSCLLWQRLFYPTGLSPLNQEFIPFIDEDNGRRNSSVSFGRQLMYAISAIARTGMKYTAKGALPKKTIEKLLQQVELGEAQLQPFVDGLEITGPYPAEAAVVLEAAFELGIVDRAREGLSLNSAGLKAWLLQSDADRERSLMNWLFGKLLLASCPEAMCAASLLLSLEPGPWHSLNRAKELLLSREAVDHDWLSAWLSLFCRAGWAELGDAKAGQERHEIFRLREWSSSVERGQGLYIQPSGELLAEPSCCMETRWELELISERRSDDELTCYQITPESVKRAAAHGRTKACLERFLLQASGEAELPDTVAAMLEEWIMPGEGCGGIDSKARKTAGIYADLRHHSDLPAAEWSWPARAQVPFIAVGAKLTTCEIAPLTQGCVPLLQNLDRLPAMWHKQLRSYHASTRKELMQQAMQLETAVQLKMDGELVVFIPDEMELSGPEWTVTGRLQRSGYPKRNRLSYEMWEEMRLLIPEGCY
ncbi:helicase-associated domain-containing protein [Paenibacillus sp. HB172176]|uniref:helicase-associated domain-containing protein n=1 Tax=Paenibacillus sp. HB172176 TaxID=2493690 RepID=UPI00143BE68B|nr:helicase-associated domain-containing protein [Paenibacillus sp. HB172176]